MHKAKYGFTLIEILVVTTIIAIMLGISSAFVTHFNRRFLLRTSVAKMCSALKIARNYSATGKSSVRVDINSQDGWMECWGSKITGCWHFEDEITTGAFKRNAKVKNAKLVVGKIGNALEFRGKSWVDCGKLLADDVRDGFLLCFWVKPQRLSAKPQTLCQVGDYYQLQMDSNLGLYLVTPEKTKYLNARLRLYRWSYVEILHDSNSISLSLDYLQTASLKWKGKTSDLRGSKLFIGGYFFGKIDQVELCALGVLQTVILPEEVCIVNAPKHLFFDHYAQLNPRWHTAPETIVLENNGKEKNIRSKITVETTGDIQYQTQ